MSRKCQSHTEEIVVVSSDSEPETLPQKKKKKPTNNEYMKEYYLRNRGAYVCEHCEGIYTCRSSLAKHQGRSVKCYIERVKAVFEEIKHTPVGDFDPELTLQKMEAVIQLK